MSIGYEWLSSVAQRLKEEVENGAAPGAETLTVKELLGKFGYMRRWNGEGGINNRIQNQLDALGLRSMPDFRYAWFGETIRLELDIESGAALPKEERPDPTYRVSMLDAAHNRPISVKPTQPLKVATTIMQFHDFSQLPVMTNDRDLKGIVSWQSIGTRFALGSKCEYVQDCTEPTEAISKDMPLFQAISTVAEQGFVIVRDREAGNIISGIVTASDLSDQLVKMAGPFLLTGEIEGHLRNLIHRKFRLDELQSIAEGNKEIGGAADLTLGDYCHLLSEPAHWERLELNVDRVEFVQHLHSVREIRNNIMHFAPEGLDDDQDRMLRDVARFFEELARIGAM